MAESKNNVVTHGLSGKIDLLVFRQRNGKTIVTKSPQKSAQTSAAQLQIQEKFQQAVVYAKAAIADAATKTAYAEKTGNGQTAYNLAIADYFNAPNIQEINIENYTGQIGSTINIKVTDDFKVTNVEVSILNGDGSLVEKGNAVLNVNGLDWLYTTTATNSSINGDKIIVEAFDLPNNDTKEEKIIP